MSQTNSDQDSKQPQPKKTGPAAQIGALVGIVVAVLASQLVARSLFPPPPGGGFNVNQTLAAAGVGAVGGAVGALIGFGIGRLIDKARKGP